MTTTFFPPKIPILLCLLSLISCHEQKTKERTIAFPPPQKNYSFQDAMTCGHVAKNNLLWLGSTEGLYCFDGKNFTLYTTKHGLCDNSITDILEDTMGRLWLATRNGLSLYSDSTFTTISIPWDGNENLWGKGMNAHTVLCLAQSKNGIIWLGTWGNGTHCFDPQHPDSLGQYHFQSYLQEEGAIYDQGDYRNVIQSIFIDHQNQVWFTSMSHGGVFCFDGQQFTQMGLSEGFKDDMVFSGMEDRHHQLWFGMLGNREAGITVYNDQSIQNYSTTDGLSSNNVTDLYEDQSGIIWMASHRGQLCQYDPYKQKDPGKKVFQIFTDQDQNTYSNIHFVVQDDQENIWWGGSYGQLYRYDGKKVENFTYQKF